uniref:Uncharacterized protein n=1 Tax=Plectus sambesii TaxID=2011161 RepID=A0A914W9H2_9BILA
MASSRRSSRRRSSASRSPRRRSSLLSRISYEALARTVSNYPARRRRALRAHARAANFSPAARVVQRRRRGRGGRAWQLVHFVKCAIRFAVLASVIKHPRQLANWWGRHAKAPSSGTLRAFWDGQVASGCRLTMMARQSAAPRHICQPDDRLAPDSFGEPGKT